MEIRLSRESEVPLRRQLAEQIVFLIGVGKLRPGQQLPIVRELARRLKIHHNTLSEAYQALVRRTWLVRHRGSRLVVGSRELRRTSSTGDGAGDGLDEVINAAMRRAREEGYSLKQLRERVKKRLVAQRPDHILLVDREPGFREIMRQEIREALGWPVQTCSQEDLGKTPGLAERAQVATPEYNIDEVEPLLHRDRPAVMVTVSEALLRTASGLLAPAVGRRHSYREFLLSRRGKVDLRGVDVAICDSLAMSVATGTHKVHYRLLDLQCLEYLATA